VLSLIVFFGPLIAYRGIFKVGGTGGGIFIRRSRLPVGSEGSLPFTQSIRLLTALDEAGVVSLT
jgi:hypothetical protein